MVFEHDNQIQKIIDSVSLMDINGLSSALPEKKLYFEMTKSTFLNKLVQLFEDLKHRGNTGFSVHAGQCKSTICRNTACKGYTFVTDFTHEHFSFVLHYKDGKLDDWSHCHDFLPIDTSFYEDKSISIEVWDEDKHDFQANDKFLQTITDVKQAKKFLGDLSNMSITKSSLLLWLNNYENLFSNSQYFNHGSSRFYKSFSAFGKLYSVLVDLGTLIKNEKKIVSIIDQMKNTRRKEHLQLYRENKDLLRTVFCTDIYRKNGQITFTSEEVVYSFDQQDFKQLFDYMELSYGLIYKYCE